MPQYYYPGVLILNYRGYGLFNAFFDPFEIGLKPTINGQTHDLRELIRALLSDNLFEEVVQPG
jgi:hypothetical protein